MGNGRPSNARDIHSFRRSRRITENQTKVSWGMKSEVKYPVNILILLIEKMLRKDMKTSLGNLKTILEK